MLRLRVACRLPRLDAELAAGVSPSRSEEHALRAARPTLLALADDLLELPDPSPRGVALVQQLLVDGDGPLYRPWAPDDLYAAAQEARHAL